MAVVITPKRVSDPLDDRVKARLIFSNQRMTGYASSGSGSEHDADLDVSLSNLVHAFFNLDDNDNEQPTTSDEPTATSDDNVDEICVSRTIETVRELVNPRNNHIDIHSTVAKAADQSVLVSGQDRRRAVMARLRAKGYNAGLCKTKWESSGGLTAGSYEYIDIVVDHERYIVDVDFAAQFKIARGTQEYEELLEAVPAVVTVGAEELKQVVRVMAEAAKRSLRRTEMSVPPWRKRRYMMAKWFGAYRRTVNCCGSTATATATATATGGGVVGLREVGFECVMRGNVGRGVLSIKG